MVDNVWQSNLPPEADVSLYQDVVAAREHDQPLRSALGTGCCPECGRPLSIGRAWRYGDCLGIADCNVDDDEYDLLA